MADMTVKLGQVYSLDPDQPGAVPAELIGADGGVRSFSLEFGADERIPDLEAGSYTVRAFLPSGSVLTSGVTVTDTASNEVSLQPPPSAHEWLGWETVMGDTPDEDDYLEETDPSRPAVWLRMWEADRRNGQAEWVPVPWPPSRLNSDLRMWKLSLPLRPREPMVLQMGGPQLATRSMVLPPVTEGRVILRSVDQVHLEATIGTTERHFDGLLRYLHAGDLASLAGFENTAELAEDMLEQKVSNLFGSLIGGYVLLALGAFDRMHSWTANLANWFPDTSDGAIVHGSRLLRESADVPWDEARSWLLEAAERPSPILTHGVNLLHRGLRLLLKRNPDDDLVAEALHRTDALAGSLLPDAIYTTFLGADPNRPDSDLDTSSPAAGATVQWLPEARGEMWADLPMQGGPPDSESSGFVRELVVVERGSEGWEVIGPQFTEQLRTKADAVAKGREQAADLRPSRLVVERADGSTHYVRSL